VDRPTSLLPVDSQ